MTEERPLRLGVSTCLLGMRVRHDGGHKRDAFLNEVLGKIAEWVPVCPEVDVGMGTPREPVRLESDVGGIRMMGVQTRTDWTRQMEHFSKAKARQLEDLHLSGFVFKSRSPSCGLEGVSILGASDGQDRGMFSSVITSHLPLLPVAEETSLSDPFTRESFIENIFAYRRLEDFFSKKRTAGQVVMFNSQHRLQLRSHSGVGQKALSRLVSEGNSRRWSDLKDLYRLGFMRVLKKPATKSRNEKVLRYAAGRLARQLLPDDLIEIEQAISAYAQGRAPLLVPLTLLRHHVQTTESPLLKGQTYLEPHPHEWMLRNHG